MATLKGGPTPKKREEDMSKADRLRAWREKLMKPMPATTEAPTEASTAKPRDLARARFAVKKLRNQDERRVYASIRVSMIYWFARIILEHSAVEAEALRSGTTVQGMRAYHRAHARLRYSRNRAKGMTPTEVWLLGHPGKTLEDKRKDAAEDKRRRMRRFGGDPSRNYMAERRHLIARSLVPVGNIPDWAVAKAWEMFPAGCV